jgi:hypothetical protein
MTLTDLRAVDLQFLADEVARISHVRGVDPVYVDQSASGMVIGIRDAERRVSFRAISVVITRLASDRSPMQARRVRYKELPPIGGGITWDGTDFDVYPDHGLVDDDYTGLEWDPDDDGEPTAETTIVKARRNDGFWLVDRPVVGDSILPVLVRDRDPVSLSRTLHVSLIRTRKDGNYEADIDVSEVFCWYNLRRRDYAPFGQPSGTAITDATTILPAVRRGGAIYVLQTPRWAFPILDARFDITDCLPVVRL